MGMRINTNISALTATDQLKKTSKAYSNNLTQLASGRRINRAADDAAGLAIADRFATMTSQAQQEIRNLQSGISYAQTADDALGSQMDMAVRVRDLAVQASNGTLTDDQRAALNGEAQQLLAQIDETAEDTGYNGLNMLKQDTTVDLGTQGGTMQVSNSASNTSALGLDSLNLNSADGAQAAIKSLDTAMNRISQNRSGLGAQMNRFTSAIEQREIQVENNLASESYIRDADFARSFMDKTRNGMLLQSGTSTLVQSNLMSQSVMSLLA